MTRLFIYCSDVIRRRAADHSFNTYKLLHRDLVKITVVKGGVEFPWQTKEQYLPYVLSSIVKHLSIFFSVQRLTL